VRKKSSDPQIRDLHDLEGQRFWAMILILIGVGVMVYGLGQILKTTDVALDQVEELTDRVEHLSESKSEPVKT
jgi:hypothetical protein